MTHEYCAWTLTTYRAHDRYGVFCTPPPGSGLAPFTVPACHRREFAAIRAAIAAIDTRREVAA